MTEKSNEKPDNVVKIAKPKGNFLERFKSKNAPTISGVSTLLTALPIYKIGSTDDFLRLHKDEENWWTPELCFVSVPIIGVNRPVLHLINDDIATKYLPSKRILRHRLALAAKPYHVFFFCIVPSQNLDNAWNASALDGCEAARKLWVQVTSRGAEGIDGYKINPAEDPDAFPEPNWPEQRQLYEHLETTFKGRDIDTEDHPALARLIGRKQDLT